MQIRKKPISAAARKYALWKKKLMDGR